MPREIKSGEDLQQAIGEIFDMLSAISEKLGIDAEGGAALPRAKRRSKMQEKVYAVMQDGEARHHYEVYKVLHAEDETLGEHSVQGALANLTKSGKLERIRQGLYKLAVGELEKVI